MSCPNTVALPPFTNLTVSYLIDWNDEIPQNPPLRISYRTTDDKTIDLYIDEDNFTSMTGMPAIRSFHPASLKSMFNPNIQTLKKPLLHYNQATYQLTMFSEIDHDIISDNLFGGKDRAAIRE